MKSFIAKYKKIIILTVLFCIAIYVIEIKILKNHNYFLYIFWYLMLLSLQFFDIGKNEPSVISIFINKNNIDIIERDIVNMGFKKIKENNKKIIFKKKNKKWDSDKININKYNNGIWEISGDKKYIKELEKYMVKYKIAR